MTQAKHYRLRFASRPSGWDPDYILAPDDAAAIKIAVGLRSSEAFELWHEQRLVKLVGPRVARGYPI